MKKRIAILLIAAFCILLSVSAMAESTTGRGDLVARSENLAAYLDGEGNLLIPGKEAPVNERPADSIISIDPYRLLFLSKSGEETDAEKTALVSIDLSTFEEKVIAENVHAACTVGDTKLYYVPAEDRTQLYLADFEHDLITVAYTAPEQIDRLFVSAEGLVATFVDNAGAAVFVEATNSFEMYDGAISTQSTMLGKSQIYLGDGSTLCLLRPDSAGADTIDTNVFDYVVLDGRIYYLANTGSAVRLKVYDPETMEQKVVVTPEISLTRQLTASQKSLFVLGTDNVVYKVNLESGALDKFLTIQAPATPEGTTLDSYTIEAMSGLLNVYATFTDNETLTFTFIEFASDAATADATTRTTLVDSVTLEGEETAWSLLEPAQPFTPLRRGSRGEAVSAIQQPLYDLGYYDYYIDGIFGYRTENAIRLLQGDLGYEVNGIADEDLQRLILSGTLPKYDPYQPLNRGDRGLRVTMMQQRLRSLGYLADAADGIFGVRTQQAVQLFQRENGLAISDGATRDTLTLLYADGTSPCSSYIDLRQGDTGYRVRELNKRLKELFYLEGSAGDTYTSETVAAVRRFQAQVGLAITGEATASVQQRLFAPNAQEYKGYITLYRGDENERVTRLQRRLKELNYFTANTTGYFGSVTENAVKLFQQKVGMRPTGIATVAMQELLFSPSAPEYVKPTIIGTPVLSIDCYEKLENGVYYLTDRCSATGNVTFGWMAEGDVASYNVKITDNLGNTYLNQDTTLNMTTVSIGSLTVDQVYTLQVTAYPQDGDANHVTTASMTFSRIETPPEPPVIGTITNVVTAVETVSRMENEIYYLYPGTVTFRWYAEGDVASYYVEIRDSKNNVIIRSNTTDEHRETTSDQMVEGEVYTLCVYAIPTNGTISDAMLKTLRFALDDQLEPVPPVDAPEIAVDGLTPDENGVYEQDENVAIFRWNPVENASQYYIEIRDSANAFFSSETTTANGYALNPSSMTPGASYVLYVTAIPEGGTVEQGTTSSVKLKIREDETVVQLDAPVLSIAGAQPSADNIAYLDSPQMTFQWTAVNGAGGYNVVIRDSNNSVCSETTVTDLSYTYDGQSLVRGAIYSVSVTAIPPEGTSAQGTPATLPFIIRPETTEPTVAPEATPTPEASPLPTEPPVSPEVPEATEEPSTEQISLNPPQLTIDPVRETKDSIAYVESNIVTFGWTSDGASGYYVEILDAANNVYARLTTEQQSASIDTANLTDGVIYRLRVVALSANGTVEDGASAELQFAKYTEVTPAPTEEVTDEPTSEPSVEPTPEPTVEETEEPTEAPIEPTAEPEPTEVPVEPTAEPEPTEVPAEPTESPIGNVSAPVLDVQPTIEWADSVAYVPEGVLTLTWHADGKVASYHVDILDGSESIASMDTSDESVDVDSSNLNSGSVYTLRVTAIPENATLEQGVASEIYFSVAAESSEATSEPTLEPTAEPTPEPTAEPTPEHNGRATSRERG